MAPIIKRLKNEQWVNCKVLATAQHRGLLDQELELFSIKPDVDLNIMEPEQELSDLTARLITGINSVFKDLVPDAVLAQGDTTTMLCTSIACFYRRIPFGHVEAGLRSGNLIQPFPEELNRRIASLVSRWHFAPTERAKQNLIKEGIDQKDIYVTGNTVIDALYSMPEVDVSWLNVKLGKDKKLVLVTVHRRENFGEPLHRICRAILKLAEHNKFVCFLIPVHPNPNVSMTIKEYLGSHKGISICSPLDYASFVTLLKKAYLILSDSGGLQEEGPALSKPVLVLRDVTERPEALEAGVAKIVGTETEKIVTETQRLLEDEKAYKQFVKGASPFGDGNASERILAILKNDFNNTA